MSALLDKVVAMDVQQRNIPFQNRAISLEEKRNLSDKENRDYSLNTKIR